MSGWIKTETRRKTRIYLDMCAMKKRKESLVFKQRKKKSQVKEERDEKRTNERACIDCCSSQMTYQTNQPIIDRDICFGVKAKIDMHSTNWEFIRGYTLAREDIGILTFEKRST